MAYMMLSEDGLLPGSSKQTLIDLDEEFLGRGGIVKVVSFINDNFKKRHTLAYQGMVLLLILFYFAQSCYKKTVYKALIALKHRIFGYDEEAENEAESEDFYRELQVDPLSEANNKACTEVNRFEEREQSFPLDIIKRYRRPEEVECMDFNEYKHILAKRCDQIDCIINDHYKALSGKSEAAMKLEWSDKPQNERIDYLLRNGNRLR